MIIFKYVEYKNFLSTGNTPTRITLNKHKSTLIVGKNGSGKSSSSDALMFALFGKPHRKINKPQLMNTINKKDLLVEVSFSIDQNEYLVKRGMKPNIFEIWKNGELINQAAANKDYQLYLEENILKLNYKTFTQIVILGSSTYIPFMQLSPAARREVIEDLLDIQIFSTMNILIKEKIQQNKTDVIEIKYKIDLMKAKIESAKQHNESILQLRTDELDKLRNKIDLNKSRILEYETNMELHSSELLLLQDSIKDQEKIKELYNKVCDANKQLTYKVNEIETKLNFYEHNDNCPTCKQQIDVHFKSEVKSKSTSKIDEFKEMELQIKSKSDVLKSRLKEIEEISQSISNLKASVKELQINKTISTKAIKDLELEIKNNENLAKSIDNSNIIDYKVTLKGLNEQFENLIDARELISVTSTMLKDGGIKTRIIKQYIPIMNKLINNYLASMDFFVDFQLDESFNEKILSRYRDEFSYSSFSEGEKLRIDLSIMFSWRAISKMRNSVSTNLILMDEILDSSLDNAGAEEFLKIINELTSDSNVFIISHRGDQLFEKFDHVIEFQKIKNFSQII